MEAIRQLKSDFGKENILYLHCTLIPYLKTAGELKTKPTQHSVKELRGIGIQPDAVICRSDRELTQGVKDKIALFCDIEKDAVIQAVDADHIYEMPLRFEEENLADIVLEKLNLQDEAHEPELSTWRNMVSKMKNLKDTVTVGIVGKYVELPDAYISINEALHHAGVANDTEVELEWIYAEELEEDFSLEGIFAEVDGILVPGGFGDRGIEGKINAIKYTRENNIPFFGICLGMQCAVIEFARHVIGWDDAHTVEISPESKRPVISLMAEQKNISDMGGTMRLGAYKCDLKSDSKIYDAYNREIIQERHRHRFEFNSEYLKDFEEHGMVATGINPETGLVEVVEIPDHPWFVGVQFHPEYKSTVDEPHPLFTAFIKAIMDNKK
jgi:CTP synthase